MLSFSKAPITMEVTESRVRFSGPEVSHTHTSAAHNWSHKGTNGFTSKWDVGSK